jgi:SAM-dependent methyltransferase
MRNKEPLTNLGYNLKVMSRTTDFLAGVKVLEEVESPINGKLTVIRDLAWGTYIKGDWLTQSGGVAKKVWETSLRNVRSQKSKVTSCLILGLGGGGFVSVIKKHWPEAKITGVDVDPVIVELGKRYLGLNEADVKIIIEDASDYLSQRSKVKGQKFDLICIDIYVGDQFPKKFETENFFKLILKILTANGIAVFNRLYYGENRKEAEEFHKKLIKNFKKVRPVYPEANVMYVCSKR